MHTKIHHNDIKTEIGIHLIRNDDFLDDRRRFKNMAPRYRAFLIFRSKKRHECFNITFYRPASTSLNSTASTNTSGTQSFGMILALTNSDRRFVRQGYGSAYTKLVELIIIHATNDDVRHLHSMCIILKVILNLGVGDMVYIKLMTHVAYCRNIYETVPPEHKVP